MGAAVRESGIPRKELSITTKVWIQEAGYEKTKKAFEASLSRLGLDTPDLYLIHMPFGDYYGSWRAMGELYENGKIRAIDVCNFLPGRLMDLCRNASTPPMANQVEMHPLCQQKEALDVMRECGVQPQAWAPFAEGEKFWGKGGTPYFSFLQKCQHGWHSPPFLFKGFYAYRIPVRNVP